MPKSVDPIKRGKLLSADFFTTSDVALICAVDASTVLHWIKGGRLKSFQTPGGHNRITREVLRNFIRENDLPYMRDVIDSGSEQLKILIVDDDIDFLKMVRGALSRVVEWGVETADSSLEAGLKVGTWCPHLVIMDIRMPGFDGIDFCKSLKKTFNHDKIPVIVMTAYRREEAEKKKIIDLGIFDYLEKPFSTQELMQKIRLFTADSNWTVAKRLLSQSQTVSLGSV